MNLIGEMKQEIKCSFFFPVEKLLEEVKKQLIEAYGENTLDDLTIKCSSSNKGFLVQVASKSEYSSMEETPKKRGRKPKEISVISDDEEDEDLTESTEEETVVEEETVDISNNKDIENPKMSLPVLSENPEDHPKPKELTPEEYRILRYKKNRTALELVSVMEYETDPTRVYDALYKDKEPEGVINEEAEDVTSPVSDAEKDYVYCFYIKKKKEGISARIPKMSTDILNGKKIAYYRQVSIIDPETKRKVSYYKDPKVAEMQVLNLENEKNNTLFS